MPERRAERVAVRRGRGEQAPYIVWRRKSDGYVSATRYDPGPNFKILLVTADWPEALSLIEKERADA